MDRRVRELVLISVLAAFALAWRGLVTKHYLLRLLLELQLLRGLRRDRDEAAVGAQKNPPGDLFGLAPRRG